MEDSAILSFANCILASAQDLVKEIQERKVPTPSFDPSGSPDFWSLRDVKIESSKQKIMDMTAGLHSLVSGPYAALRWLSGTHYSSAALRVVLEFRVLQHIPKESSESIENLAKLAALDEDKLLRILRLMTTHAITTEVADREFSHTAFSLSLVEEPDFAAQVLMQLDEMNKASAYMTEYLRYDPRSNTSHHSPFSFLHGEPFYQWYDNHPSQATRFAQAQAGIVKMARGIDAVTDWLVSTKLKSGSKLVDVGAGNASLTLTLAEQHPELHFVAQDLYPKFYEATKNNLTADLASRVSFKQHDFFKPQPHDTNVSAYLLRCCLHNWSDSDAKRILRAFGETLAKNSDARLLINEMVLPLKGEVSLSQEQESCRSDIVMLVIANSRQRSEGHWRSLVQSADCGIDVFKIQGPKGGMCVIEVGYTG